MAEFRKRLFSRIVPNLKKVGLFGPKVQQTFLDMGVLEYQDLDPDETMAEDQRVAEELERILAKAEDDGEISAADAATRAGEIATAVVDGGR